MAHLTYDTSFLRPKEHPNLFKSSKIQPSPSQRKSKKNALIPFSESSLFKSLSPTRAIFSIPASDPRRPTALTCGLRRPTLAPSIELVIITRRTIALFSENRKARSADIVARFSFPSHAPAENCVGGMPAARKGQQGAPGDPPGRVALARRLRSPIEFACTNRRDRGGRPGGEFVRAAQRLIEDVSH
jgi:hypothetical protein